MTTLVNDSGMGPRELLESLAQEQGPGGLISAAWVLENLAALAGDDQFSLPRLSLSPLDPADTLPALDKLPEGEPEPSEKKDPAKSLKPAPGAKPVRKAQEITVN